MTDMSASRNPLKSFGMTEFLWRWGASLTLVLLTYNPAGFSYLHWLREDFSGAGLGPVHFLAGAVLLAGWAIYVVATQRSLGTLGVVLGTAVIGGLIWLLVDLGVVSPESTRSIIWLSLIALATLLAVGLSWSHMWRRMSGQLEVDDD